MLQATMASRASSIRSRGQAAARPKASARPPSYCSLHRDASGGTLQGFEEALDSIVVDAEITLAVARLGAHFDQAVVTVSGRPYLDHEIIFELKQSRSRDPFHGAPGRTTVRHLPSGELTRDYFDSLIDVIGTARQLQRCKILINRRRFLCRRHFRLVAHVAGAIRRQGLCMYK